MAVPDGKPATDFSAMNREWVRGVASETAGGGIPAPENPSDGDVLTYDSTSDTWVAAAPSGWITVETLTATENITYTAPEGKAYSPVTVNVPSDFSTATVEIVNTIPNSEFDVFAPIILDDGESGELNPWSLTSDAEEFTIALYKGTASLYMRNIEGESIVFSLAATGDIEITPGTPNATITGNGTITIS